MEPIHVTQAKQNIQMGLIILSILSKTPKPIV